MTYIPEDQNYSIMPPTKNCNTLFSAKFSEKEQDSVTAHRAHMLIAV